jgi:hypothetical protein
MARLDEVKKLQKIAGILKENVNEGLDSPKIRMEKEGSVYLVNYSLDTDEGEYIEMDGTIENGVFKPDSFDNAASKAWYEQNKDIVDDHINFELDQMGYSYTK